LILALAKDWFETTKIKRSWIMNIEDKDENRNTKGINYMKIDTKMKSETQKIQIT
jgi:hypothetical protein